MEKNEDLLTFSEFCKYMGIWNTLGKEIINHPKCNFVLRVGRRVFIYKPALELEIQRCVKNKTNLKKEYCKNK